MKINLDDIGSTQVEVNMTTLAEDVCAKLNDKFKTLGRDQQSRSLFISLHDAQKRPIEKQLLRLLLPNERVLQMHNDLKARGINHTFYALPPRPFVPKDDRGGQGFSEQFSKEGTVPIERQANGNVSVSCSKAPKRRSKKTPTPNRASANVPSISAKIRFTTSTKAHFVPHPRRGEGRERGSVE